MGMTIKIAAANSSEADKKRADAVCLGQYDELVINEEIKKLTYGGTIKFLDGDYYIDSFPEKHNTAIFFDYNNGIARVINIEGDTENKTYNTRFGVVFHVTENALNSIPEGEEARVFGGEDERPEAVDCYFRYTHVNNVNFSTFYIMLNDAQHQVVGIDCRHFGGSEISVVGVYTEQYFDDRYTHLKPATPKKGCIGIRSCHGSNDEMARLGIDNTTVGGLYTGFEFCGIDHLIMRNCFAARCCYGYVFNYMDKTMTMINCCDEGNTHMPLFNAKGRLTAIDFNLERFDSAYIPDDPDGNTEPYAAETEPGGWHGFISYTLQGRAFGVDHFWKNGCGRNFKTVNLFHELSVRPHSPEYLETYFDNELNKLITWTGEKWVDAMGNEV